MSRRITTSDRNRFHQCRQKWDFESPLRLGYNPRQMGEAFALGIAFHEGAAVLYDPETWDGDRAVVELLARQTSIRILGEQLETFRDPRTKEIDPVFKEKYEEHVELMNSMWDQYIPFHRENDHFTPVMVEVKFRIEIPGMPDVIYEGRIDVIVKDEFDEYWVLDHKTAASFGELFHLDIDTQISSYLWALQKVLGIKIAGFIYSEVKKSVFHRPNVLKNGSLSKNKQQNTTYRMYLDAIESEGEDPADYADFLTYLLENPKETVRRHIVRRSAKQYEAIEAVLVAEVGEMIDPDVNIYPSPSRINCAGCPWRAPCQERLALGDWEEILADEDRFVHLGEQAH